MPSTATRPQVVTSPPSGRSAASVELDRQVQVMVDLGYGDLTGLGDDGLRAVVRPLHWAVPPLAADGAEDGSPTVPFVLVLAPRLVPAQRTMPLIVRGARTPRLGFVSPDTTDVEAFTPIDGVHVPDVAAYLLTGVQRGEEYRSWSPDDALPAIVGRGRTPLTVHEGIALVTAFPHLLEKNRCFMLLASRCADRRVPALWISGGSARDGGAERRGAAKLGWCWAGNQHTWLGHASGSARIPA